jgi:D-alanyl-D-alanine carboxypeptidase
MNATRALHPLISLPTMPPRPFRAAGPAALLVALALGGCAGSDVANSPAAGPSAAAPTGLPSAEALATAALGQGAEGLVVVENGLDEASAAKLAAAAEKAFAEINAPGAIMAVASPAGVWKATIGSADIEGKRPMSADLYQRIGSITKTFTVTALLQLAAKGLLSLDDPLSKYIQVMAISEV